MQTHTTSGACCGATDFAQPCQQVLSPRPVIEKLLAHAKGWRGSRDYRQGVRLIEQEFFDKYAGELIGNQVQHTRRVLSDSWRPGDVQIISGMAATCARWCRICA